jgi:hypothetical protein
MCPAVMLLLAGSLIALLPDGWGSTVVKHVSHEPMADQC